MWNTSAIWSRLTLDRAVNELSCDPIKADMSQPKRCIKVLTGPSSPHVRDDPSWNLLPFLWRFHSLRFTGALEVGKSVKRLPFFYYFALFWRKYFYNKTPTNYIWIIFNQFWPPCQISDSQKVAKKKAHSHFLATLACCQTRFPSRRRWRRFIGGFVILFGCFPPPHPISPK